MKTQTFQVTRYDSAAAVLDFVRGWRSDRVASTDDGRDAWAGASYPDIARWAISGSPEHGAAVAAILDGIAAVLPDTDRSTIEPSMVPGYVCVADALCGLPESFRRRALSADACAPVRFIVDMSASCHVGASILARRGAAICAAIQSVLPFRPVTLEVIAAFKFHQRPNHTGVVVLDIDPRALDLDALALVLACPGFLRRPMFDALRLVAGVTLEDVLPRADRAEYIAQLYPDASTVTVPPVWTDEDARPFATAKSAAAWVASHVQRAADLATTDAT